LGLPLRDRDGLPVEFWTAILPSDERVPHVVLVVTVGIVVRACVSSTALLARETRDHHGRGQLEQEAELERLREVAVEDVALVLDEDPVIALAKPPDDL